MAHPANDTTVRNLRYLAILEGSSLLLILLVTMPLKYLAEMPTPNKVVGMTHGLLTMLYVVYLLWAWSARRWNAKVLLWGLAASLLPFVFIYVERTIFAPLSGRIPQDPTLPEA